MSEIVALTQEIRQFVDERDWAQFHDPKSVFIALSGEVGEVAELLQWLPADQAQTLLSDPPLNDRFGEELADVFIYLLRLADITGIDLPAAARAKILKNAQKYPIETARGNSNKH